MVQAELRAPYAVDLPGDDLEHYVPIDPTDVGFLVTAAIGPKDADGVEVFDFFVCTPRWLAANVPADSYEWGRHKLILPRWDYGLLLVAITELCATAVGPDWGSVAVRLARYGAWEFEEAELTATSPDAHSALARTG